MKRRLLLFTLLLVQAGLFGQLTESKFLFSHEIEAGLATGKLNVSSAAYRYTYIGNYIDALSTYDVQIRFGVDTFDYDGYKTASALDKIVDAVKDERLVVISESHLKPQHRIFAKRLIDSLADHGFKYLGMETICHTGKGELCDTNLTQRGFPLISRFTGVYTREPKMAELVRTALRKGYKIFGYERTEDSKHMARDEIQADNMINYLSKQIEGKAIIICGWDHAAEKEVWGRVKRLAQYYFEKTGINPFTIYQDNFSEKIFENEHPLVGEIHSSQPVVLVDIDGSILRTSDFVDVEVIHPRTKYYNKRPTWLFENSDYRYFDLTGINLDISYPMFVIAYYPGERQNGVPADIVELRHKYDWKNLVLKKGKYEVVVTNRSEMRNIDIVVD